jgi:hypothetical protein
MAFGLDDIIGAGLEIINKFIPDPAAKAAAAFQMAQLQQQTEFKELDAQIASIQSQTDTNKAEATNQNLFVAGWRPFIGWICGTTLGYTYILAPIMDMAFKVIGHPVLIPAPDMSEMMPILLGMLGLGGMRTYEKTKGINSGH